MKLKHILSAFGAFAICIATSAAATLTVSSLADSGSDSLWATIASASAGDTIQITAKGAIVLTGGEIVISKNLNITGPGSIALTISGNNASRIFSIIDSSNGVELPVSISGVTLSRGAAVGTCPTPNTGSGGAIVATESLTRTDVVFSNNTAVRNGGGLAWASRRNGQTLTLANTNFLGNTVGCATATVSAQGGGLYIGYEACLSAGAAAIVSISNSVFDGNSAVRSGGGVPFGAPVTVRVNGTRLVNNSATNAYGG